MSASVVVVDYGIGNVFSVMRGLEQCGASPVLTGDLDAIRAADRVVLPGVGAFGRAADRLRDLGHDAALRDFIDTGRPFLGICVGLQLLMETGFEFGEHEGLGMLPGTVAQMELPTSDGGAMRIPQIGWFPVTPPDGAGAGHWDGSPLGATTPGTAFYFVHSFSVRPTNADDVLATVNYGGTDIVAAVRRGNVAGLQFHPERSGPDGLALLQRFLEL